MQNNELHKLGKTKLLTIIYEQEKQIEELKQEIKDLNNQLEDRTIKIKEAGSIADASMKLNKIFEVAQQAADEYLRSIKEVNNISSENEKSVIENEIIENVNEQDINTIDEKEITSNNICTALIPINNQLIVRKTNLFNKISKLFIKLKQSIRKFILKILNSKEKISKNFNSKEKKSKKIKSKENNSQKDRSKEKESKKIKIKEENSKKEKKQIKFFKIKKDKKNEAKKVPFLKKCDIIPVLFKNKEKVDNKEKGTKNVEAIQISIQDLEKELKRRKEKTKKINFLKTITLSSVVIIAFAIIAATRIFNVLQVSGTSMEPSLYSGDLLITTKIFGYEKGDMIAFYYNNSVLIKRVIATEGDTVYIDDEGVVYVNSQKIEESYVKELAYGNCDVTFPYRVPDKEVFILGDNRETSIDSRNKAIGTISEDKILGKITVNIKKFLFY